MCRTIPRDIAVTHGMDKIIPAGAQVIILVTFGGKKGLTARFFVTGHMECQKAHESHM
jgi:hypothetical protein